ncbi:MAG: hypothetical protein K2G67_00290 [Muribaculaceae bacterium]|nr:hypothetical protein [Muribaculaceae bacterium]
MVRNFQFKIIAFLGAFLLLASCRIKKDSLNAGSPLENRDDSICRALDYQLKNYPESQYRDVYKNFMQDFFGPGHILSDTAAAGRYLRSELSLDEPFDGPLFEPTGYQGNFYRVNLSLVKDGVIDYPEFFNAFISSVQDIVPPSGEDWMKTWGAIDSIIKRRGLTFPDEIKDREDLSNQFENGRYIVHHSHRFNESFHFHYRIISRKNFEEIIIPLIHPKE